MAIEISAAETWLYGKLKNNAAGVADRVYETVAPEKAIFPYVVFIFLASHDVRGVGPARIMASGLWLVKGVDRAANYTGLKAIADKIDDLLQGSSGSNSDGTVLACVREEPFKLTEEVDGEHYRNLGGIYRIWSQ